MTAQVAPEKVYAVVVGVEKYAEPTGWDVPGPAAAARLFAQLLRRRGVPADNVRLFLEPIDGGMTPVEGVTPVRPTRDAIELVFTSDIPDREGELLFVYWSGHGVLDLQRRRLFYPTARERNLLNLDLSDLLMKLRCEEYRQFARQVVLVDACANILARGRLPTSIPNEEWAKGDIRPGANQFALCAASEAEVAVAHSDRRGGLSREVFDLLDAAADIFPPDMDAVFATLKARFQQLRDAGETEQVPTCIVHRDWDGAEIVYSPRAPTRSLAEALAAYKRGIDLVWRGGKDEDGKPILDENKRPRGKWVEMETHKDFRDEQ